MARRWNGTPRSAMRLEAGALFAWDDGASAGGSQRVSLGRCDNPGNAAGVNRNQRCLGPFQREWRREAWPLLVDLDAQLGELRMVAHLWWVRWGKEF